MTKYLKYLLSLFLAFGLMVNDGTLDAPSNSADYYQFSNVILRRELNSKGSKLYVFHQVNSAEKTSFLFQLDYLQFQDSYSLQIPVILKFQTQLYQKVSLFAMQHIFINEMITSRISYTSLYTA
ncbi:hypothetical protein BC952_0912 [Flavobacterium limicola]|uniref:Uncharacterized protein n=1 Tax=Flavobacterium limicola TaxID=180441 RepID=A0A495S623_9FLAO|nr:hypothetical protein [Flavobacterium limicola]RKS95255.1 hypothetical protein BC952_0912 [Flavobacterium limicola]